MRVLLTTGVLLASLLPWTSSAAAGTSAPAATDAPLPALQTQLLRYRGVHFGEHPVVTYESNERIFAIEAGKELHWQRIVDRVHDERAANNLVWKVDVAIDAGTATSRHEKLALPALGFGYEIFSDDKVVSGTLTTGGAARAMQPLSIVPGDPVVGAFYTFGLVLSALPLSPGFDRRYRVVDMDDSTLAFKLRPFRFTVAGQQTYRLRNAWVDALLVKVEPLDDNRELASSFLVTAAAPHITLRHEMVAVSDAADQHAKSTGTEALVEWTQAEPRGKS